MLNQKLSALMGGVGATAMMMGVAFAQTPSLTIYTYDSFTSEWGPGPAIEKGFEAVCDCDVQFVTAGDGAALLSRLKLEGTASPADLVLGIDNNLAALAQELLVPHGRDIVHDLPLAWEDPHLVPYDWGYFAFIYDETRGTEPPTSLEDLTKPDQRIIIQDPRSSTPGLGLLTWVKQIYGDKASDYWSRLAPNLVTVTKGWSEAYGLFLEGEADLVLSYSTSPAYHMVVEEDMTKEAALFANGHGVQIELAGVLATSDAPELAADFLQYLTGAEAQSLLPTTNWMYPANRAEVALPEAFNSLISPQKALILPPAEVADRRDEWVGEWRDALVK